MNVFYAMCVLAILGGSAYVIIKGDREVRIQFMITVLAGVILLAAVKEWL